jgi:hypothetical protein
VEELIQANTITIDRVITALGCSRGLAYSIMQNHLKFRKVCTRWVVPRELKDREKINRMGLSVQHPLRYADKWEGMLNRIVTGDESWVHHYQPESKHASMQLKHILRFISICVLFTDPSSYTPTFAMLPPTYTIYIFIVIYICTYIGASLHRNGSYSIVACEFISAGTSLRNRCLAMNVYPRSAIAALRRHVTIL